MKTSFLAGAALAALVSTSVAQAQSCAAACDTRNAACTRAGRDYGTCMGGWHQCRSACLTPARVPAGGPKATPVVARR